jgi:PKD repeat protein
MSSIRWILVLSVIAVVGGLGIHGCAPTVPELLVEVTANPTTGTVPVTTVATATISGGVAPYGHLWTSAPGGLIAAPLQASTNIVFPIAGTYTVTCTVTDSTGTIKSGSVTVHVLPVGSAAEGQTLFNQQCIGCHPSAVALKPNADQITNNMGSINPAMNAITLTDQQVADLQAYLNSL